MLVFKFHFTIQLSAITYYLLLTTSQKSREKYIRVRSKKSRPLRERDFCDGGSKENGVKNLDI